MYVHTYPTLILQADTLLNRGIEYGIAKYEIKLVIIDR